MPTKDKISNIYSFLGNRTSYSSSRVDSVSSKSNNGYDDTFESIAKYVVLAQRVHIYELKKVFRLDEYRLITILIQLEKAKIIKSSISSNGAKTYQMLIRDLAGLEKVMDPLLYPDYVARGSATNSSHQVRQSVNCEVSPVHSNTIFTNEDESFDEESGLYAVRKEKQSPTPVQSEVYPKAFYLTFWSEFIEYNRNLQGVYADILPSKYSWISKTIEGLPGMKCRAVINKKDCRTEIYIENADAALNKRVFDFLYGYKEDIEKALRRKLMWQRLDEKAACRIKVERKFNVSDPEERFAAIEFMTITSGRLIEIITPLAAEFFI